MPIFFSLFGLNLAGNVQVRGAPWCVRLWRGSWAASPRGRRYTRSPSGTRRPSHWLVNYYPTVAHVGNPCFLPAWFRIALAIRIRSGSVASHESGIEVTTFFLLFWSLTFLTCYFHCDGIDWIWIPDPHWGNWWIRSESALGPLRIWVNENISCPRHRRNCITVVLIYDRHYCFVSYTGTSCFTAVTVLEGRGWKFWHAVLIELFMLLHQKSNLKCTV